MPATVESAWRCSSGGASRLPRAPNRAYSADTMTGGTTIAGQIERLITRLDGAAVCDGCVTDRLNLSVPAQANVVTRPEEHTSELQSLMRISYAVFCLKKKTKKIHTNNQSN